MIILYGSSTSPNVLKVRILLEEAGIPYKEKLVRRDAGENRTEEFLKISATGTLPAMIDEEAGARLFESSAMLLYLADKYGRFLPADPAARADVYKWLVFEVANVSPAIESIYKLIYLSDAWIDSAMAFHRQKLVDSIEIMDKQLGQTEYLAGDCSIADFALFPLANILEDFVERPLADFPNLDRWYRQMRQRDGVQRATAV